MKTYIIYLAAGNSERFGSNKLLYKVNDKELYRYGLDELIKLVNSRDDCKLIVVTQHFEIVTRYPQLTYIYTSSCKKGISYSIKAGMEMIEQVDETPNIMLVSSDQPFLNAATLAQMIDCFNHNLVSVATLAYRDKLATPMIFANKCCKELMQLKNDQDGKEIIDKYAHDCLYYQAKSLDELVDIDHQEDILKIKNEF